jgi:hypothetical protein
MPLTNGHAVFASLSEDGINKFFRNFATARPHDLHFATAGLGGSATGPISLLPLLTVPGLNFGLNYRIDIETPKIDFFPQTLPLPPGLTLGTNQFSLTTSARVRVLCAEQARDGRGALLSATLQVWAVGRPTVTPVGTTDKLIGLAIDDIVLKDVGGLEKIAECIAKDALNALLLKARYLVQKQVFGAFSIFLADGPLIADNQIKVWANLS